MKKSNTVVIPADKSRELYKCSKDTYLKLLNENVTKTYRQAGDNEMDIVNQKSAEIAKDYNLEKRMHIYTTNDAFITIKDHKPNFMSKKPARLINPSKTDIGIIAKKVLDDINNELRSKSQVQQWKSTQDVLQWFRKIDGKKSKSFFKFDVDAFYPSISKELLMKSLKFAQEEHNVVITKKDIEVILHAHETFLFHGGKTWVKKGDSGRFDVPMGSFNGAETCELVGLFLLSQMTSGSEPIFSPNEVGLYRDDGLAVIPSGRSIRVIFKKVKDLFKRNGLDITSDSDGNLTTTCFLDVNLDLLKNQYYPYRKPNDTPLYININSDHPPIIKKKLRGMIENRLSQISSSKEVFDNEKAIYEKALKDSGHPHELNYQPPNNNNKKKRKPKRLILWYNPPYSDIVKTNIGRKFLALLEEFFPKGDPLHKYLNRSTVKLSYRTMGNLKNHIEKHNARLLRKDDRSEKGCNCRNKVNCPVDGKCQETSLVYQADVHVQNKPVKTYFGLTERTFKERYDEHKHALKHRESKKATTLSTYVWKVKDETGTTPEIKWSIKSKAFPFSSGGKRCDLCTTEKLSILMANPRTTINKRGELLTMCMHKIKFRLGTFKPSVNQNPPIT